MGDSAMSMMSGPHGDLGPAHNRKLPGITAATISQSLELWEPPLPLGLHHYQKAYLDSARLKKSEA